MSVYNSLWALGVLSLAVTSHAQSFVGPVSDLYVVNKVIAPDGFNRSAVLVDGQFPAPLIKANKGDNFRLNVHDFLDDTSMQRALTIHWHGLFQHHTNWADGVAFVTQCPVVPGNSFQYDFTAPGQTGTFWYHSHYSDQYCDGLRGPLVIYDPNDPYKHMYDVDDESTVITISDWNHLPTPQLPQFPITINSTLINGKGRYPGGPQSDLAVITVEKGKRYRMRLVSISCDPNFIVWIDGHSMTVIEADGELHEPVTVGAIPIFAGQRYSFILDANQPVGNYWIWSQTGPGAPGVLGASGGINSAILRYIGAKDSEPTANITTPQNLLNETQLHPRTSPAAPGKPIRGGADVNINLPINLVAGADSTPTVPTGNFSVNNVTYDSPTVPVLLQILNGAQAQKLLPPGSVYSLPANKVIELSFPMLNTAGGPHPLHLHGHSFSVVRSAGTGPNDYNYVNPPRRDVVSSGNSASDNVTIRFETDNPGPWILHCHIDYHLASGFAVVFAEEVPQTPLDEFPIPLDWAGLCPEYYHFNATSTEPCTGNQCAKLAPPPQPNGTQLLPNPQPTAASVLSVTGSATQYISGSGTQSATVASSPSQT
ncbi:Cu-oxidase-domain-containing protein [Heliocybe sulcata]|uniref:Cu-oxidase-domain-containing protein n=1 Tax=Heliocybe sulcata TaxID=5364 RepID=A0A5C3MP28_9AGAM|nr:Cu-oxidase-domain-containing protein [Heliocybe sulcata]